MNRSQEIFQKARDFIVNRYSLLQDRHPDLPTPPGKDIPVTSRRITRFRRRLTKEGYSSTPLGRSAEISQVSNENINSFVESLNIQIEDRKSGFKGAIRGMVEYINGQIIIDPFDTNRRMAEKDKYENSKWVNVYKAAYGDSNQIRPTNMTKVITGLLVIANEMSTINHTFSEALEERGMNWFDKNVTEEGTYQQLNEDQRREVVQKLIDDAVFTLNGLFPHLPKQTINIT